MIALLLVLLAFVGLGLSVFNPLSGISGSVSATVSGTSKAFAFTKWTLEMKCVVVKANNFTGGGYSQVVAGMVSAQLTLEADTYDQGNMPLSVGAVYPFTLGYTSEVDVTVSILIESITPSVDYEGGQPIKVSGPSTGSFTAAIA